MKSKPVVDKQLADDIEKLLKDNDVDEKVIVEVVGKINNNDDNVDADGEEVDLFNDGPEKVEKDEESEELDKNSELEDEDLEAEEESDDEDLEEESDDDFEEDEEETDDEESEDEDESDEEEVKDEDEEIFEEDDEEVEDEDEEVANPLAKLDDPKFREGFDKGYQFALALLKNNMLPEAEDSDEEVKEEEKEISPEHVADEDKVEPVQPQPEMPTEKKAVGDSVEALKEKLSAEINQLFKSCAQASEKVKPLVGSIRDVTVFDSAEAVYGFALKQNGVDIRKYNKDAYEGMVDMMLENLNKQTVNVVVGDAKDPDEFNDVISGAFGRLKKIEN